MLLAAGGVLWILVLDLDLVTLLLLLLVMLLLGDEVFAECTLGSFTSSV